MLKFNHFKPKTIEETCSLLRQYNGSATVVAGGTDLVVRMKRRDVTPDILIDISYIPGLNKIEYNQVSGLKIGPICTHSDLKFSPDIREKFGILAQAAHTVGSVQVRNLGTIGGNLCHASPASDLAPALIALNARVKISGLQGTALLDLENFFEGTGKTVLKSDEILAGVEVPKPSPHSAGVYLKQGPRKAMDIAVVSVAVVVCLAEKGSKCDYVRIALGAVAPTPIRTRRAEDFLRGEVIDDDLVRQAAKVASEEAKPVSDLRGSAEFRKTIIEILTKQTITEAIEQAKRTF
jgi:carbon-monoxide dehydrogenase medium subunit